MRSTTAGCLLALALLLPLAACELRSSADPVEEVRANLTGSWTAFSNRPTWPLNTCLLLTNGDVMCQQVFSDTWHRLRPNAGGNYQQGTWDNPPIAPMPHGLDTRIDCNVCAYAPNAYASAVLPDGRVVVIGGEHLGPSVGVDTNIGFIYDPLSDTWSSQLSEVFGSGEVGDTKGTVLQDGTFILGQLNGTNLEALNPATGVFTARNPTGKRDLNQEETWNILYDGTVLTVDSAIPSSFERYDPTTNTWGNAGTMPVNLADAGPGVGTSQEVGPCALRPDGKLFCFSGNSLGQNALYDTATNTWSHTAAMDFPVGPSGGHFAIADGPAAPLPNGNILAMASPVLNGSPFNTPSHFYEFDMATNTLAPTVDTPSAPTCKSFGGRMLVLPTGEVLLTGCDVMLYSNGGAPAATSRPSIRGFPGLISAGGVYTVTGRLFNGFSEGASYGDDAQSATNYPLVRLTNTATNHVYFARTFNHSRMGVERVGSTASVTTTFQVPVDFENGASTMEVVVNGIASPAVSNNGLFSKLSLQGWTPTQWSTQVPAVGVSGTTVQLKGALATTGTSQTMFTLPVAARPSAKVYVATNVYGANVGRLIVDTTGVVTVEDENNGMVNAAKFTSLEGVSFATTASGFTTLTLQNGWTQAPFATRNAALKNDGGIIRLQGAMAAPIGSSLTPFVLPAAFRPPTDVYVPIGLCNARKGRLQIQTSGVVTIVPLSGNAGDATCFTSLEGVTFAAASTGYTAVTLQNGWTNAPYATRNVAIKNDGGIVRFQGAIAGGTSTVLFTLPFGWRPARVAYVSVDLCNGARGRLRVQTDGTVAVEVQSLTLGDAACFTSLEGASFSYGI